MDFAYRYTQDQEGFRREVIAWLDATLPRGVQDLRPSGPDGRRAQDEFRRKLGARGWLAPLDSQDLGGGGLSPDENVVLLEEFNKLGVLFFLEDASLALRTALLDCGSDAQRDRLVLPLAAGEVTVWKQRSVGGHPLDPDAIDLTAVPDADGYILSGQATFSGSGPSPSLLWTLALVESDSPGRPAAISFLVPPTLDGIEIATPRTLADDAFARVSFDRVWVPRSDQVGDDGAAVMRAVVSRAPMADLPTTLEAETDALLDYARGAPLSAGPIGQQLLVEAYISSRVMRLLRMRAGWLDESSQGDGHEEAVAARWEERASQRLSEVVQQVVGVYAQLDESDPRAVAGGRFERLQRAELTARSDGVGDGSPEALIAAALGLINSGDPAGDNPGKGNQETA
jgi:alkylation response protein AidB-like acyl-CoA dehydrogenase